MVRNLVERVAVLGRNRDDTATAGLDFADVADNLVEERILGSDDHDGHVLVDKGDGTVLHFGGGVALRMDVADFLELERTFHRDGVVEVPAQVEEVVRLAVLCGKILDFVRKFERLFGEEGQIQERPSDVGACFKAEAALAAEQERNHGKHGNLRSERLGARNADFGAGV